MGDKLRPRTRARNRTARLTAEDVERAWREYDEGGMSVAEIAGALWQEWGYANAHTARMALYQAFRREGKQLRDKVTAGLLRYSSI